MRLRLAVIFLLLPFLMLAQKKRSNLVTFTFDDQPLEVILDTLSSQTGYFFSYNSDIFPEGSKYTLSVRDQPIDQVLSKLLVGTRLKYSFFKDQIILNYEEPQQQEVRKRNLFDISGKLRDENGQAISGANVFLNGSNIGTYTDIDGNYRLESVPPGYYDLVFSHVGYVNGVYQISEYNGGSRIQNHRFAPDLGQLEEVEVISDRITRNSNLSSWAYYYNAFKSELLGLSAFSRSCVIENPEVLHFYFDDDEQQLTAYADAPIIIRNDALGYKIDYYLESFRKKEGDLRFRGKIRFSNQEPSSGAEKKLWRRNRKSSYLGSFSHFKKSLLKGNLREEGFRMYREEDINDLKLSKSNQVKGEEIVILKGDYYELRFRENLVVEYKKEKESIEFLRSSDYAKSEYDQNFNEQGMLVKNPGNQVSIIRLLKGPVKLDFTGQIVDKFGLTIFGYMSWERTADLVPINYDPKWDKFQ